MTDMMDYFREQAIIALRLFFSPLAGVYWAVTGKDYLIAPERKERRLKRLFGERD
jgi:hypothetical protein